MLYLGRTSDGRRVSPSVTDPGHTALPHFTRVVASRSKSAHPVGIPRGRHHRVIGQFRDSTIAEGDV